MNTKEDYGLYLEKEGNTNETIIEFNSFTLFNFTVLCDGLYSTTVIMNHENGEYLLSLNFNKNILEKLLDKTTKKNRNEVEAQLEQDTSNFKKITLSEKIDFGVLAYLGDKEQNEHEEFIPLIAKELI